MLSRQVHAVRRFACASVSRVSASSDSLSSCSQPYHYLCHLCTRRCTNGYGFSHCLHRCHGVLQQVCGASGRASVAHRIHSRPGCAVQVDCQGEGPKPPMSSVASPQLMTLQLPQTTVRMHLVCKSGTRRLSLSGSARMHR